MTERRDATGSGAESIESTESTATRTRTRASVPRLRAQQQAQQQGQQAGHQAGQQQSSPARSGRPASSPERRSAAATPAQPESTSRRALPTITLPRITVPSALTDTRARVVALTAQRIGPIATRTERIWGPALELGRWIAPLGWMVLLIGLASWFAGARWNWPELLIIATVCLVLFLACLVLALGRTRVSIDLGVDPGRVTVGERAAGRVEVSNDGGSSLLPIIVEVPVGASAARFTLPVLSGGEHHEELFVVPTSRRGVIDIGPAQTVQGDPLGLIRRVRVWSGTTELYVHPVTTTLENLGTGLLRDLEGEVTPDLSMSDLAFHALREYQPGDDRRYIHWRSSAKHGRLLVRQFLDTRRSHLAVVVDTTPTVYSDGEDGVELGISCAASLAMRSIMDEQDTTIVCHDQTASRTTAPLTLDAFARATVAPVDVFSSAGTAASLAPDASVAVLVTGAGRPFIQIQRALGQFETEVGKVAIIVDPHAEIGVRRAAGVSLLTINALTDLRRVIMRGVTQ